VAMEEILTSAEASGPGAANAAAATVGRSPAQAGKGQAMSPPGIWSDLEELNI